MVHTRHSKDTDNPVDNENSGDTGTHIVINGHSTPTSADKDGGRNHTFEEESTEFRRETRHRKSVDMGKQVDGQTSCSAETKDCNSKETETMRKKRSHCLQEPVVNLYDLAHDNELRRRSLRNVSRQRDRKDRNLRFSYNDMNARHSRKKLKDSLGYDRGSRYGRSLLRKSDRHSKKLFETFNIQEIQKTMEKKHREMLELQEAAMHGDSDEETQEESEEEEEEESEEEEEEEEEEEQSPGYSLRKSRQKTKRYEAPSSFAAGRRRKEMMSPMHHKHIRRIPQHASSPSHRRGFKRRRTSSTSSSSDEEAAFERRKSKSMAKSRSRCLPMNFNEDDMVGIVKQRERAHKRMPTGSSLADVDPMTIDNKTKFTEIGGLDHHIRSLKEMVIFPLLYTEVFQKFNINPPRGVIFHGPPGTGKTLVARALANECSSEGKKVAFFMRKGADCLSKWVGESERQLRLLFDQAYAMRPSIIFFDEIDGIAPVRSTRQDQIHSSIVSTLLALMDGLDARGEVIVIGATNRLDAIDPALRRPGRFDREFLFSLPNRKGREKIFEIHTASWQPKLSHDFIVELADKAVGYCGADIKALCTETALFALRRRYPQIYQSSKKLQLDTNEIKVSSGDFKNAMKRIVPASQRANHSAGFALPEHLKALLASLLKLCVDSLGVMFPAGKEVKDFSVMEDIEEEDDGRNIFERGRSRQRYSSLRDTDQNNSYFSRGSGKLDHKPTNRPRLLIHGNKGNGQTSHIAPAILYSMEHLTMHMLDLPSLFSNSSRTPEETIAQVFREARRTSPCIIYLPHIGAWWNSLSACTHATFVTLLQDLPADMPILFLSTAEEEVDHLPEAIQEMFSSINNECVTAPYPASTERYTFFKDLLLDYALRQPEGKLMRKKDVRNAEVLPEAPCPKQRELTEKESKALLQEEESVLRELRLFLREITWKLLADRKFKEFSKPVDLEEVDDYLEVIGEPMDLSTVMTRINAHSYYSCAHFLKDIDLITNNCLEYNPDKDQLDRLLRTRACELRDTAQSLVYDVLDKDFEKTCIEIYERRTEREKKAPVLLCDHTLKNLNQNTCAFCEVRYDKKNEKTDWLECKACHQWFHERCFCKYSPTLDGAGMNEDNALNPPSFLKVIPKQLKGNVNLNTSVHTSPHSTSAPIPNYLTKPKVNIPTPTDPHGSRYSRRVRGLSESEKSTKDLDEVLSRKRSKLSSQANEGNEALSDNSIVSMSEGCQNDDIHLNISNADSSVQTHEIIKSAGNPPINDIEKEPCDSTSNVDINGVKRNLEFENPAENKGDLLEMEEAELILNKLVENTFNHSVDKLVRIRTTLTRIIARNEHVEKRADVLEELKEWIDALV